MINWYIEVTLTGFTKKDIKILQRQASELVDQLELQNQ